MLVIEDITNYLWSYFQKEKLELKNVMMGLIKNLKTKYNIQVQYMCCNNAKENVDFERVCKQERMGLEFEYIAPGAPQ